MEYSVNYLELCIGVLYELGVCCFIGVTCNLHISESDYGPLILYYDLIHTEEDLVLMTLLWDY